MTESRTSKIADHVLAYIVVGIIAVAFGILYNDYKNSLEVLETTYKENFQKLDETQKENKKLIDENTELLNSQKEILEVFEKIVKSKEKFDKLSDSPVKPTPLHEEKLSEKLHILDRNIKEQRTRRVKFKPKPLRY